MEEEQAHTTRPLQIPSSSGDAGASSSSSLPPSHFHEESETNSTEVQVQLHPLDAVTTDFHDRRFHRRRLSRRDSPPRNESYRFNFTISSLVPRDGLDDIWSCLAVLVTFWFFASMTLILGFYGSESLQLGPYCSQLITANELFVQSIQAQQTEGSSGPMLYGFHTSPVLDVETTWGETHNAAIQTDDHNEWMYYFNAGSKVDISYDVKNSSLSLSLVIAQGEESLIEWIEDPSYPNTTLSWNTVYGSGTIEQEITSSDTYYVAVGNLNSNTIEVQLNLTIKALLYNTTQAYYKCSLYNHVCSFSFFFLKKNAVIITSPGPDQVKDDQDLYIKLSYGPRWLAYVIGSVILTVVVLLLFRLCHMFQPSQRDLSGTQTRPRADNQDPLLSPKDDDLSSWGSSYDSVSNDEEELDELLQEQGKQVNEGENSANPKKLCVICFDSPRDCFFLPCGHCAACFTCGSRIAEEAGTCPICRRRMKKVRKIFSV